MVTPAAKRKAVSILMAKHGMSELRAGNAIGGCRMTVRYNSRRPDDTVLPQLMIMSGREHRRFGYRRLLALLMREGSLWITKNFSGPTVSVTLHLIQTATHQHNLRNRSSGGKLWRLRRGRVEKRDSLISDGFGPRPHPILMFVTKPSADGHKKFFERR